ncbi:GntR family transcriptional regulator [Rhodobacteraceae bacterium N5(2021)]|uniref:GntR family transcriptional regulator n=1 Tax=Gymnodinialimonas phycosphaerae TaxID=2841589 RepID=A0A975TRN3_9RHOB|nr:GntR family transcriptional regulator [Gymnodinialimonas phycosphaerae]MBY4893565.1 GntR family transcriptional regulator [Gymnodinialimonas phycosphaerae]
MQADTTPKYEHAYRVILGRLKAGRYPIGGRMPTESELARHFDVSRVTIRRALDMLVQDGYVESKQGSGYTVLTLSPASDTCLTSFTDAMLRAGHEPTSRFLSLDHFAPGAPEIADLPPELSDTPITRLIRLRLVDGTPRMLVMTYAPSHLLKDATAADFPETGPAQSILRILSSRFRLNWSAACEDISPVLADADMARIFEIEPGLPLLKQACSAFDDQGRMVFHEDVFRNGRVSFNLSPRARTPRHH